MIATEAALTQRILATLTAASPTETPVTAQEPVVTAPPAPTQNATHTQMPPTGTPVRTAAPAAFVLLPTATPSPLVPTPTATLNIPGAVVNAATLNVRSGPGIDFAVVGSANQGDWLTLQGRNEDGSWLEVVTASGVDGWVSADLVSANVAVDSIAVAAVIPTPPPAPTQAPVPTTITQVTTVPEAPVASPAALPGLHVRQTIGTWEIQPERLHNEKTVWHYGDPTVAMGTYAIVIVLAKNLAPGTTSPSDSLWFALVDDQGRDHDYSDPLTTERLANIAAAWQFVVHPTPFTNVDPGVETPMLMLWDVAQDVQSLKLVISDNVTVATWDLGNFSNIPPFEK
jgi:uncharacterized protein YgiM (DUF1202 family)